MKACIILKQTIAIKITKGLKMFVKFECKTTYNVKPSSDI